MKNQIARKILYLTDQNALIDQPLSNYLKPFEKISHRVQYLKDRFIHITGYEMYFTIYQQVIGDGSEKRYAELLSRTFLT